MTSTLKKPFRFIQLTTVAVGVTCAGLGLPAARAAEDKPAATADASDAEGRAWSDLKEAVKPPTPPEDWKTVRPSQQEYMDFMGKAADAAAGKIAAFLAKYPDGAHVKDARKLQMNALQMAAMTGNKERAEELGKILAKTAADTTLSENERVGARFMQLQLSAKDVKGESEMIKTFVDGMLAIQKDFPKNEQVYAQMMQVVSNEEGPEAKRLAKVIAESPDAPAKMKQKAQDILDGKVFSAGANIGKPIDIKFTAVDGTEVDLSKMKGKVVLVDFWATWCGPCVAEIPHVKEAYQKYHDKGFEIIGISFDREKDKEKLIDFTKEKGMTWPQYFDGKYWNNDFGQRFNIHSIPAMWLFDKNGNLAEANAREDLAGKVAKLLEAK
jgi:thiol-disulfide isomerase/thioredoxin